MITNLCSRTKDPSPLNGGVVLYFCKPTANGPFEPHIELEASSKMQPIIKRMFSLIFSECNLAYPVSGLHVYYCHFVIFPENF